MMKSKKQIEIDGLKNWRNQHSKNKIALLEKSWALAFHKYILPYLPLEFLRKYYSDKIGRKSKKLYSAMGTVVLQQFIDLLDNETVDRLAFDQQWHFV